MTGERAQAERFAELFRAVYLTFHRRDGPRAGPGGMAGRQLAGASRAVLEHLALAGPLTVGEAAAHMSRAQSVISEIVAHLERQGLLEREDDPADRRRTLIWLTPRGHDVLRRDREVLGIDHLARALARLPPGQANELIAGLRALVDLAPPVPAPEPPERSEEEVDDHTISLRELRDADRDRPLLQLLHRREWRSAVVRGAFRPDDCLAGTTSPGYDQAGDRAPDAGVHGHHAGLAGSPAGRG